MGFLKTLKKNLGVTKGKSRLEARQPPPPPPIQSVDNGSQGQRTAQERAAQVLGQDPAMAQALLQQLKLQGGDLMGAAMSASPDVMQVDLCCMDNMRTVLCVGYYANRLCAFGSVRLFVLLRMLT